MINKFLIIFAGLFGLVVFSTKPVNAIINDPCKVCISNICSTVASPPHCAAQYDECSSNSMCGGIDPYCSQTMQNQCPCGCTKTVSGGTCTTCPTSTSTPPPTATTTPSACKWKCDDALNGCGAPTGSGPCGSYEVLCTLVKISDESQCYSYPVTQCNNDVACVDNPGSACTPGVDGCVYQYISDGRCGQLGCGSCQRPVRITTNCNSIPNPCGVNCSNPDPSCGTSCVGDGGGGGGGTTPGQCTVSLLPSTQNIALESTGMLTASVNIISGSVNSVVFDSIDDGVASVDPAIDYTPSYSSTVTTNSIGTTTINAYVSMNDGGNCSSTATVVVGTPGAWWQVVNSDVYSAANLYSYIPGTCTLPTCNPVFGLNGPGGYPGVAVYLSGYDFLSGSGLGMAASSPNNWIANTSFQGKIIDYSYFSSQIPNSLVPEEISVSVVDGSLFESGGTLYRGYYYYHFDGTNLSSLTINGDIDISGDRKVVVLAESANIYLNGNVDILSPGNGFFMIAAGKDVAGTSGYLFIDDLVTNLDGVYFAESEISTGAGDTQLVVNGSVVANGGIALERDLVDNSFTPAEVFNYAPEIVQLFPSIFNQTRMRWKEVVP